LFGGKTVSIDPRKMLQEFLISKSWRKGFLCFEKSEKEKSTKLINFRKK